MTDGESTHVEVGVEGTIGRLTLDRPARHNSLVPSLLEEIEAGLATIADADGVRCVVVDANGPSFSTGGDVAAFYDHRDEIAAYARRTVGGLHRVVRSLLAHPQPTVVAADGQVTGGSVGLLAAADLVYLGGDATITPYYPVVGFAPDGGWTSLVPRLIGRRRTAEVLMTNRTIAPSEATAWGLATEHITDGRAIDRALTVADDVAALESEAVMAAVGLLRPDSDTIARQLDAELEQFVGTIQTDAAVEGMARFLER